MLKALFKKQFLELNSFLFQNKKSGKNRSKAGIIGMIVLFAFIFLSVGAAFLGVSHLLASALLPANLDWLYFSLLGMMALVIGVIGDVFTSYSSLFQAKDNDLLLAMPIPPAKLLAVRMTSVYMIGLLYEALALVPAIILYWIETPVTALGVILPILMLFVINLVILVLSCVLGWVVALIASKLKNKTLISVLASLLLIAVYYVGYFRINTYLQDLVNNAEQIGKTIQASVWPIYHMGLAMTGNLSSFAAFALVAFALAAITLFVLSRSFLHIVTANRGTRKAVYREKRTKRASVPAALLRKEFKRFLSSAAYILNAGLGIVLEIVLSAFILIRMSWIRNYVDALREALPFLQNFIPPVIAAAVMLIGSMNAISAPSVSLEGKTIWLTNSLPINPWDSLKAKLQLHMILNAPAAAICVISLGITLRMSLLMTLLTLALTLAYIYLIDAVGLTTNLKKPVMTWTNETIPIKSSMSVAVCIFGGFALVAGFGVACYFFLSPSSDTMAVLTGRQAMILSAFTVFFGLFAAALTAWIKKRGAEIFAHL